METEHGKLEQKYASDLRNARTYKYLLGRTLQTVQESADKTAEGPVTSNHEGVGAKDGRFGFGALGNREKELLLTRLVQMFEAQLEVAPG